MGIAKVQSLSFCNYNFSFLGQPSISSRPQICGWFWQGRNRGRFWVERVKCVSKHVHNIIIVSESLILHKKSTHLYIVQCSLFFISVNFLIVFKFLVKFSRDLKSILKTDFANLWFLELWERQNMSINLNYIASENSLKLTWLTNPFCVKLYFTWGI